MHSLTYWCAICFLRFRVLFRGVPGFFWGVPGFLGVFRFFLGVFRVFWGCSCFFLLFRNVPRDVPVFLEVLHALYFNFFSICVGDLYTQQVANTEMEKK